MAIHFSQERWARVRDTFARWWAGTLERPAAEVVVYGAYAPESPRPAAPLLDQSNCHDFRWSASEVVDALDDWLSQQEFLGDAFPFVNFHTFGPGVLAAFCGAKLDNSSGRVWFFPEKELPIEEISIRYDPENRWVRRIKEIYREGLRRWQGMVLMGMPDLGGVMDVVSTFCGAENLLMALYDAPEEVLRLCGEAQEAWFQAYWDLAAVLRENGNPGYSDWSGIYSAAPSYILQSDFAYMIGPEMFRTFVLPHIEDACQRLDNAIYHLDGVGQLVHLDMLLALPRLQRQALDGGVPEDRPGGQAQFCDWRCAGGLRAVGRERLLHGGRAHAGGRRSAVAQPGRAGVINRRRSIGPGPFSACSKIRPLPRKRRTGDLCLPPLRHQ